MEYVTIKVPKKFRELFRSFQPILGYRSFNEFCVEGIRHWLDMQRVKADMALEKLKKAEVIFRD